MSRAPYAGPKLPQVLLDKVGTSSSSRKHRADVSRKDRRQAERTDKGKARAARAQLQQSAHKERSRNGDQLARRPQEEKPVSSRPAPIAKPIRSILKRPQVVVREDDSSSDEEEPSRPVVSETVKSKLQEDDAEIAALERKLGIRGKQSTALKEDGLDWITNGVEASDDSDAPQTKRDRQEDDTWLQSKRRKLTKAEPTVLRSQALASDSEDHDEDVEEELDDDDDDLVMDEIQNPFSDDELSEDDFDISDEPEKKSNTTRKKTRENPYVAPVSAASQPAKYIPPSLRKAQLEASEDLTQLRRQLQGQMNRLSDTNFLSILQGIEDIYAKNARQNVSTTIVNLLSDLVNAPSTLSETFLILYAGLATAIFKVVGADFAATLLEKFTTDIDQLRSSSCPGKNVLNLIGFLSNTYVLQMTGSSIIFGYIRLFLDDFTEDNTELLLRIVRTAGLQLRADDPTSLKDIVLLLTRAVSKQEKQDLSVRTKFMIETINDLKNNRVKTNAANSAITSEHIVRMRKTLGALNTRALRATEPLQISLEDIRDSEKKGKWWLVGASYHDPAKLVGHPSGGQSQISRDTDDGYQSETPGHVSVTKLARSQGMNTDVRRSVFVSIMSATDFEDAYARIAKLNLKNKQIVEVPKVLLHCAGAEKTYNPYYTIVARRMCTEKRLQKAFQSSLWDTLRKLDIDTHGGDDPSASMELPAVVNLGRLFGTLIADDCLAVSSLKTVEFSYPSVKLQSFVEVLFTTIMLRCAKREDPDAATQAVFAQASSAPRMVPGLRLFVEQTLSTAAIANGSKERKAIKAGCHVAMQVLSQLAASAPVISDSESESDMSMAD